MVNRGRVRPEMSWNTVPADVQEVAVAALTEKQLEAFKLELAGLGIRRIAEHLQIRRQSVADRLLGAHDVLLKAGVRQDEFGLWTHQRKDAA